MIMQIRPTAVASSFVLGLCAAWAGAGEPNLAWPQFRGPAGSGVAESGEKPPVEVGPDKNVRWKVPFPSGYSSPIVVGDMLVTTAFDDGKLYTLACRRVDGKELWRTEAPAEKIEAYHKTEGSPAASTPVTDGQRIVSYFGSCGLFCYDLAGKQLWHLPLPTATTPSDFGTGTSPILADGIVILVRDELKDSRIYALSLETGKPLWEKKRQSPSAFTTPVFWDTPEGKQIVAAGFGRMIGYDLKTGEEVWSVSGMPSACCTTPVISGGMLYFAGWSPGDKEDTEFQMPTYDSFLKEGDTDKDGKLTREECDKTSMKGFFDSNDSNKDGFFAREEWDTLLKFISSGKNSAFALKAGGKGDITATHVVWKETKGLPYVPSAIVYKDQYVLVKDGGLVTVYDTKTGKVLHQGRSVAAGRYYSSPVAANGLLYLASLDEGAITVLRQTAGKPEQVAQNPPLGERVAATPVIADNTLYVRTAGHLYAFTEGAPAK
jgi:outer membrane protein assembly factor BamB